MKSWHLIVDVARCHDCNDCFLADKDEFVDNEFPPYSAAQPWHGHRWMNIKRKERGQYPLVETAYLPTPCMHCDAAPCLTADGAVYKRDDGLVIIDPVKAKGRKEIVASCPYSAIYWNEEKELAQKCTGCAHLLDGGWEVPRCVDSCPTDALRFGEESEFADLIAKAEVMRPELGTRPRVYYLNIPKKFIAGTVYDPIEKEVVIGATCTATPAGGGDAVSVETDAFGEGFAVGHWFAVLRMMERRRILPGAKPTDCNPWACFQS